MQHIDQTQPILVTGASGYVAGWIIKGLLEQGHRVHATVRNLEDSRKTAHLHRIAEASSGSLQLFAADLLAEGAFLEAMQGCAVVIHTASPFVISNYRDAFLDLVQPALLGTKNVLASVNQCPTVQRVVLTSSIAATYGDAIEINQTKDQRFDESHWNHSSNLNHQPYHYAKTIAERAAWELQQAQQRWDLVCINPALVMGPSLTANSQSGSIEILKQFGDGTMRAGTPAMWNGLVDVRDVAQAHIQAALAQHASGRYIICGGSLSLLEMGNLLKQHFGKRYPFPPFELPKALFTLIAPAFGLSRDFVRLNMGYPIYFNNLRSIQELNLTYRDIRRSVIEHFQQLIDDGIVKQR
jgi:nucleoside-diphosphate-sugar epimerase